MPLIVIGLGNPGEDYSAHRHNVGFRVVDRLAEECGIRLKKPHWLGRYEIGSAKQQGRTLFLVKPLTFMNCSGEVIKSVLRQTKASLPDLFIVCDNLDLSLGVLKLKQTGSSGGHRGLESIFAFVKTTDVMRLSIGIGRPRRRGAVIEHVLGVPDDEERILLENAVGKAASFILRLLTQPVEKVMNEVNRRAGKDDPA